MAYRNNSLWNDKNEIACLVIFKILKRDNFPRSKQKQYCDDLSKKTDLKASSINAKICNIKSLAGINEYSNFSKNTKRIYEMYKDKTVKELENIVGWVF